MADIDDLLAHLDRDSGESDHWRQLKPYIRFKWPDLQDDAQTVIRPLVVPFECTVSLNSGREIHLQRLYQFNLYEGMLAGMPVDTVGFALEAIREANRLIPGSWPILMLRPILRRKLVERPSKQAEAYRILPVVANVAFFRSTSLKTDPEAVYSALVVIWFQGNYGMPDDLNIIHQIRDVDWESEAAGFDP